MLITTKKTIRDVANIMGISKSTIHNDMRKRLKSINNDLYLDVNKLFLEHIKVRHLLGGLATKKKYKKNTIK